MVAKVYTELVKAATGINKHDLDEEQIRQPALFHEIADQLSYAIGKRDEAKGIAARVRAQRDADIREEFAKREEKLTEKALQSLLDTDPEVEEAEKIAVDLNAEVRKWGDLKETIVARGHSMRQLTDLYIAGYYTTSSAGSSRSRARDVQAETVQKQAGVLRRERVRAQSES